MGQLRDGLGGLQAIVWVALAFGAGPVLGASWDRDDSFESMAAPIERPPVSVQWDLAAMAAPAEEPEALPAETGSTPGPRPAAAPAPSGPSASTVAKRQAVEEHAGSAPSARSARERCAEPSGDEVVRTGDGSWTVHRDLIRRYSRDWTSLDELGWSKAHEGPDGRHDGMLIGGVRCGSDLHRVGIRAGDVVHAVNGREVKNLPQALLVYAAVRNDPLVSLEISRKGQRRTLTYRLIG